ncbi:hypothetical protein BV20DRAFT_26165 [Pilatotrama ljubarskyi]|nr:hypothetical protein BV20DRAFT_26165 [Pilatotrama ljubarskyi]
MNVVREINKINERELDLGTKGSWHDDYKDSAYIFVGGLHRDLTEGDVITIFSQYGEIMDVNMPRDKETGKPKGYAFVMYEDQRSTILAVDNLNGAKVLDRTIRVDHVKKYRQPKEKGEDGELHERDEPSLNAKPPAIMDDEEASESSDDSGPEIDPEDPMRDYLIAKRKEEKAAKQGKKSKSKRKHKDETPEERKARKERKRLRKEKAKSAGVRAAEELLNSLGGGLDSVGRRRGSPSPRRSRSRTPIRNVDIEPRRNRHSPPRRRSRSRDHSPPRRYRSRTPPRPSRSPIAVYQSPRSKPYDDDKRDVRHDVSDRRRPRYDDETPPRTRRGYD